MEKDKWCPWCGKKLSDQVETTVNPIKAQEPAVTTPEPAQSASPTTSPVPTMTELPMPENQAIEQYLLRARIEKMNEKLKEAKEKINQYLTKIEAQGATISDDDIQELKVLVQKIKTKRDELVRKKIDLPFEENLLQKRQEIEGKLRKVQNTFMTQKISEVAFNKLKEEYESELNQIKAKMTQQNHFEQILKTKLEKRQKILEEELEVLKAKLEIQELTEESYQERLKTTQKELDDIKLVLSKLIA